MKLFIGSDYHLEILPPHLRNQYFFGEDCVGREVRKNKDDIVFVMAGDLNTAKDPKYFDPLFAFGDAVYTTGNHEYWGADIMHVDEALAPDVREAIIENVTFLTCPLFSDPEPLCEKLPDFQRIKFLGGPFTLDMHKALHKKNVEALKIAYAKHKKHTPDNKLVVVTHFLPLPDSISLRWKGDKYTSYFHTDLTDLVNELNADLWVHGHTHDSLDYIAANGKTRVICNPYGYPEHDVNPEYNSNLIVEI